MSAHLHETIVFPDVEALLVDHLSGLGFETSDGGPLPVATRVPNPRPDEWLRVLRTGGPRQGIVVDQAQITFEYWADDSVVAQQGAQTVRAHVSALRGRRLDGHQVHRVQEMSGPANLPDPTSGQERYTWSVLIDVRGHAI